MGTKREVGFNVLMSCPSGSVKMAWMPALHEAVRYAELIFENYKKERRVWITVGRQGDVLGRTVWDTVDTVF